MSESMDYKLVASKIIEYLGGSQNLEKVGFCATRIRVTLVDYGKVDLKRIEEIKGVIGTKRFGNQIQIVIGPQVKNVYEQMIGNNEISQNIKSKDVLEKTKMTDKIFNYITNCITPIFVGFITSGLIKAVITVLQNFKLIDSTSTIFLLFTAAGNAIFYFLPVFIAYTASKYLKSNTVVAMIISLAFLDSNYTALLSNESLNALFKVSYSSQFIPVLLAIPVAALIEKFLEKKLPKNISSLFTPLITILVSVCVIFYVIGPLGSVLGTLAVKATTALNNIGMSGYLTIFGVHLALVPLILQNMTTLGYDSIAAYMNISCYVQTAIALGTTLALTSKQAKSEGLATVFTGLASGITEPALFGYVVKNKSTLIILGVAGAIGGAIAGFFKTYFISFVGGVFGWISNWSPVFPYHLLAIGVSSIIACVASYIVVKKTVK